MAGGGSAGLMEINANERKRDMTTPETLAEVLKTPLRLNAREGDRILVITDTAIEEPVWRGLQAAARALGMTPTVAIMEPRAAHAMDPDPAIVSAALDPSNGLAVYLTSTALAHAPMNDRMLETGRRFVLMEELTAAMLDPEGPAGADYHAIDALGSGLN